jgi:hypothetical protein
MKIWLAEYVVFHHCPFMVKHSDENKRYVVTCRRGCPWTIHARKGKDDSWMIISVVQPHTCLMNVDDRRHTQLSSRFISQRLVNIIKNCPLMTVTSLIEVVMVTWKYRVKYGRAWQAKCDRTTSKMRGFVSQDHIGGFSTKRECANTHK